MITRRRVPALRIRSWVHARRHRPLYLYPPDGDGGALFDQLTAKVRDVGAEITSAGIDEGRIYYEISFCNSTCRRFI